MDMRTLLLERACLLVFCTLVILSNLRENREMRGVRWFAASNVGYLIGGLLIASRAHLPVWAAVVLANLLYSLGYVFLHRCMAVFFGQRRWYWPAQVALCALSLLLCTYFTLIHPDIRLRLALIGLTTGLQFAICTLVALHGRRGPMRGSAIGIGLVVGFSAALNLLRVLLTLVWGTTQTYLKADDIQTTTVMLNTTIFVAIDIAFVWMIATSLRNDLQTQATTDSLTGVLNRRALEKALEAAISHTRQTGQPLAAVMLDLDCFKQINDSLGHRAGDCALVDAAQCMREELRQSDLVARMGGDEFVIVLPNCTRLRAHEVAERLRGAFEERRILLGPDCVQIKASFGVAMLDNTMKNWEMLIAECDRALYTAKSVGGNFVYVTAP